MRRRAPSVRSVALAFAVGLAATSGAGSSLAQDSTRDKARQAYDAAVAAASRGDHALAAVEFARADHLAPNPVALESALKATLLADDAALGMMLVERAGKREGRDRALDDAMAAARDRFAARTGKVVVSCPAGAACTATLDREPIAVDEARWVTTGPHVVEIDLRGRSERHEIVVVAGRAQEVSPRNPYAGAAAEPPPVAVTPGPSEPSQTVGRGETPARRGDGGGISPAWFWVGLGATAIASGFTIASAVDTKAEHDAWVAGGATGPTDDGRASQRRTNVLFFTTVGLGAVTAGLALFAVRWSPGEVSVAAAPGGARASATFGF